MTQGWKLSRWGSENVPHDLAGVSKQTHPRREKGFRGISPAERWKGQAEANAAIFLITAMMLDLVVEIPLGYLR